MKRGGRFILFLEAACLLLGAGLAIRLLPFDRLARLLAPKVAKKMLSAEQRAACLSEVRWAVLAASRRAPWRSVCFHQGIAVQRMLCRRGIYAQLNYGVGKKENGLAAHVWATAGDVIVVGGEVAEDFVEIVAFPPG